MKADEEIKKEIVENIRIDLCGLQEKIEYLLSEIVSAETVEEVMRKKQLILLLWLDYMPMDEASCYFCLLDERTVVELDEVEMVCQGCKYAKMHGYCIDEDSDYAQISRAREHLRKLIQEKYYGGERYE